MRSLFYWSSLDRALKLLGDKTAAVYIWITPILAKMIHYVAEWRHWDIHSPVDFDFLFVIAGFYLAARTLYQWKCPEEHKGVSDLVSLMENGRRMQHRIRNIIDTRRHSLRVTTEMVDEHLENYWTGKGLFSEDQFKKLKPILVAGYIREIDTVKGITKALKNHGSTEIMDIETAKPEFRYLIGLLLILSVFGSLWDFCLKAYEIIQSTL